MEGNQLFYTVLHVLRLVTTEELDKTEQPEYPNKHIRFMNNYSRWMGSNLLTAESGSARSLVGVQPLCPLEATREPRR